MLGCLATSETTRIHQFIANNQASFDLGKGKTGKKSTFSKYYEHGCRVTGHSISFLAIYQRKLSVEI